MNYSILMLAGLFIGSFELCSSDLQGSFSAEAKDEMNGLLKKYGASVPNVAETVFPNESQAFMREYLRKLSGSPVRTKLSPIKEKSSRDVSLTESQLHNEMDELRQYSEGLSACDDQRAQLVSPTIGLMNEQKDLIESLIRQTHNPEAAVSSGEPSLQVQLEKILENHDKMVKAYRQVREIVDDYISRSEVHD